MGESLDLTDSPTVETDSSGVNYTLHRNEAQIIQVESINDYRKYLTV